MVDARAVAHQLDQFPPLVFSLSLYKYIDIYFLITHILITHAHSPYINTRM
jgi:hypothetical protein